MEKKKVSLMNMILFTVCGIIVLDTFVQPAASGASSITIWIITAIFFFIPYGLANAELGAAYPENGGLFVWVKKAFGDLSATLAGWFYWLSVAFWMPAVFVAFSYWFSYAFAPDLGTWPLALIAVALCWGVVYIGVRGLEISILFTNIAAILKMFVLAVFGVLGIVYGIKYGFANDFSLEAFKISFDDALVFAPAIVFNLLGFEMISSVAGEIDDPQKNVPKMTVLAGLVITFMYVFGTFGVLVATPADSIDPLDGFYNALLELTTVLGPYQQVSFNILISITLFTLVSNMISWSLAGVEVLDGAELDKTNSFLAHKNKKYDTPDYSYYLMGALSTFLIVLNFALSEDANEVFWTILSFSFVIFLLPYVWMFPALIKLRITDSKTMRPYLIPGGMVGVWIVGILGELFILAALFMLFYTPFDFVYHTTLVVGTILCSLYGVYLYKLKN